MNNFITLHPWMFFWMVMFLILFVGNIIFMCVKTFYLMAFDKFDESVKMYIDKILHKKISDYQKIQEALQEQRELDKKYGDKDSNGE